MKFVLPQRCPKDRCGSDQFTPPRMLYERRAQPLNRNERPGVPRTIDVTAPRTLVKGTPMRAIVHSFEEIVAMLRPGLTPITDNRDALLALGFERSYRHVTRGYESMIWGRATELPRTKGSPRMLVRERAFLEKPR
jgi:hypothetical protein